MSFRLVPLTLNGVMALILRYFTEFGSFRGAVRKRGRRCSREKSLRSLSDLLMSFLFYLTSGIFFQHFEQFIIRYRFRPT